MNKEQLYKLLNYKVESTPSDISRLRELVDLYPYFDVAKFLYLKSLYEHDIHSFKGELSRLSVLLSDREALFYYIFKSDYAEYFEKTGQEKLKADKTDLLLEAFFEDHDPETSTFEYENTSGNLATTDYLSYLEEESAEKERKMTFGFRTEESFSNLIYIEDKEKNDTEDEIEEIISIIEHPIQLEPIIEDYIIEEEYEPEHQKPLKHQSIIDNFIEKSKEKEFLLLLDKEDLKGDKDYPAEEEVKSDSELGEDMFFTETLAKIYTKQGRFQKAHEIIEHLSLKYPKKNSYFADQLSYLEKLIINSKYKNKK